jgi:hypothetical protein
MRGENFQALSCLVVNVRIQVGANRSATATWQFYRRNVDVQAWHPSIISSHLFCRDISRGPLRAKTQTCFGVVGFGEQLLRQTGHAQAISELIGVRGVSKGQSTDMIHIRVSRIDLLELAPNLASLLRATQMAQR